MTNHKPLPPPERLNELLKVVEIDSSDLGTQSGLVWRTRRGPRRAGSTAGCLNQNKRTGRLDWVVRIDGANYAASRVIYLMRTGVDPSEYEVDHVDRNSLNNNLCNLRLASGSLQAHNRKVRSNNTSGSMGVAWSKQDKKWRVQLRHQGVLVIHRLFSCKLEAARTYNDKVIEMGLDKINKPLNNLNIVECSCELCISQSCGA